MLNSTKTIPELMTKTAEM